MVERGEIVKPGEEEKSSRVAAKEAGPGAASLAGAVAAGASASGTGAEGSGGNVLSTKDTVLTNADGVIRNSLCVGFDCANSNTYSDTTVLLTENNTRIKFDDTSTISGFPNEDWELQANSSNSGGGNFFAINDCGSSSGGGCADDPVFIVEGGAPANSIRVDNGGRVGFGTANPVVELHVVDGDTPTLRLDQDGSSGFAPQKWDVAGNETSFFVRDATNGSTLPFRIRPGAPSSAIDIAASGNVGIGTGSPSASLHIKRTDGTAMLKVEEGSTTESARELAQFSNNGTVTYRFTDTQGTSGTTDDFNWIAGLKTNNQFIITLVGTIGAPLWRMDSSGNVTATSFNPTSSRALKEGFTAIDPKQVLDQVVAMPISEWKYKKDVTASRHLGPVAEDFRAAFGLGADGQHISVTDLGGVSLAAIQGLDQVVQEKDRQIQDLKAQNADLSQRLEKLEQAVKALQQER
jgi:hypothetical protein